MNLSISLVFSILVFSALGQECPYGFSGDNCKDECGIVKIKPNLKIVNGVEALAHSWPSIVYVLTNFTVDYRFPKDEVRNKTLRLACAGTLIDRYTILSAGHCFPKKYTASDEFGNEYSIPIKANQYQKTIESVYNVYVGMHNIDPIKNGGQIDGKKVSVHKVITNWDYNENFLTNDIAIIKLKEPVELNDNVQLACLPNPSWGVYPKKVYVSAYAPGWGTLKEGGNVSATLQNVRMYIEPNKVCDKVVPEVPKNWKNQICSGDAENGKDTCNGDSGGPLFVVDKINSKQKFILSGIVSYGDGCGKYPGIYTRVSGYLHWIKQFLGKPQ